MRQQSWSISKLPSLGEWTAENFGYTPPLLDVRTILFGNVLGIFNGDIVQTAIAGGITLAIVLIFRRDLLFFCFDPNHARAIGLNTQFLYYTLLALLALTAVAALHAVGLILVVAMLITPGATGYLLTDRFTRMQMLAIGVAVTSCILGGYLSFYLDASPGGCIVAVQALIFFGVVFLAPRRGLLVRARQRRSVRLASTQLRPATEG